MRKIFIILITILILAIPFTTAFAKTDKWLPDGYEYGGKYDDGDSGWHTITFDNGEWVKFRIEANDEYTYVSEFRCSAVMDVVFKVKGGNGYILYYFNNVLSKSGLELVSPINSSGHPANISHVEVGYRNNSEPTPTPVITEPPTTQPPITTPTPTPPVNPQTGDKITTMFIVSCIGVLVLLAVVVYLFINKK